MSMWSVNEDVESNDVWVIFQSHDDVSNISTYGYLIPEAAIPMICGGAIIPFLANVGRSRGIRSSLLPVRHA